MPYGDPGQPKGPRLLPHHKHWCLTCHEHTTHHIFPEHESVGDRVLAWCKNCKEDRTSVIGEFEYRG